MSVLWMTSRDGYPKVLVCLLLRLHSPFMPTKHWKKNWSRWSNCVSFSRLLLSSRTNQRKRNESFSSLNLTESAICMVRTLKFVCVTSCHRKPLPKNVPTGFAGKCSFVPMLRKNRWVDLCTSTTTPSRFIFHSMSLPPHSWDVSVVLMYIM